MGTPSYMAPEQALGRTKDVGPAADIYALGRDSLRGPDRSSPLKGETVMETVRLVIHEDPVPPSRLVPRLARDLETICLKCLNKDPQRRYATAEELADDLDRYREGRPIKARPTTVWERGYKWAKRRPVAALSVAAGVLAAHRPDRRRHRLPALQAEQRASGTPGSSRSKTTEWSVLDVADKASSHGGASRRLRSIWPRYFKSPRPSLDSSRSARRVEAKQKWVGERLEAQRLSAGGRATRSRGPRTLSEVPGPEPGRPVVRDGLRSAEREGPIREAPGLGPCRADHLRPGSGGVRRGLDPGGAVAGRVAGYREGQGGRRLLQPALDPIAGGRSRPRDCGSSTGRSGFARRRPPRTTAAAPSASSARATSRAGTARIEKPAGSIP